MAFSRRFSKKRRQTADKIDTSVEEMQSHSHIPQPKIPPKAYTHGERCWSGSRSSIGESLTLLRESKTLQTMDNLSKNTLQAYERLLTNTPTSLDELSRCQECGCHEKVVNLIEENNKLRMENAELKADLETESEKHMEVLEYWVKAEKELGGLLRAYQVRHEGWRGHADYYEEDNDVGDIEGESEEGNLNTVAKP